MTSPPRPLVIGHRGAPGYLPDHTLAGYQLAIDQGADLIEPDLVATRDGVLVARHENALGSTTDVAERFPERKTTRTIDGQTLTDWFTEDFTLEELRTLRARQPLDGRPHDHDGRHLVPTLAEILELVRRASVARGTVVGLCPETKHPTHFAGLGLDLDGPLASALGEAGYTRADTVYIQSFEVGNLARLRTMTDVRLLQLIGEPDATPVDSDITYGHMLTDAGLAEVAARVDAIGVHKTHLIPVGPDGRYGAPNDLVERAHAAGLEVHVYTFRSDPGYLHAEPSGSPEDELARFYGLGVDAVFADHPDHAVAARSSRY